MRNGYANSQSSIPIAIQTLPSIPPALAVQALCASAQPEVILRALVNSQLPVPAYRAALRQGVDAETGQRILRILFLWVSSWEKRKNESFESWVLDVDAVERGEMKIEDVKVKPLAKASSGLPDLELVSAQQLFKELIIRS